MTLSLIPRRRARAAILLSLTALALGACSEATAPTKVTGSFTLVPGLNPVDLTPDGATALLEDRGSAAGDVYFYDISSANLTQKAQVGSPEFDLSSGISGNLKIVATHGKPEEAGVWTEGSGWTDLGNMSASGCEFDNLTHESDQSSGYDISSDGHNVVGLAWLPVCRGVAFYWTDAAGPGGFVALDHLGASFPGDTLPGSNRATKISDDGSLIGGWASTDQVDRWPAIWRSNGTGFLLPSMGIFTTDQPGEILAVSANGSMVAGTWAWHGFYYTDADGVVDLGPNPPEAAPDDRVFAKAIAADNKLIFGTIGDGFFSVQQPFVWTKAAGMRTLSSVLADYGVEVPAGFYPFGVMAASNDGSVVMGWGYNDAFQISTWILRLPVKAYGL
jgi:hypothetical protein